MPQSHDQLLEELRSLLTRAGVEPGQVTIGGSGALGALGLRTPKDLDVHVPSEDAWKALQGAEGGIQSTAPSGSPRVQFDTPAGEMEFFTGPWSVGEQEFGEGAPQMQYSGVPHWTPEHTLAWKRAMGRPKDQPDIALLEQHLQPKVAAIPSQEELFQQALQVLPERIRSKAIHASGGLPDAKGISDVDISYFTRHPHNLLRKLPEGTTAQQKSPEHTIYSLPGYPREVNLFATKDRYRAGRAPAHRATQIALQEGYPDLAEAARKLKAGGLGTEKAWFQLLGATGDPYEEMMDKEKMLGLAQALQKTAKAHKLSRRTYFRGLHISVETDKGELRHWYDKANDEKGTTKMKYPYGYIRRTKGTDGDHVDVYVGPNKRAKNVYVIHQMKAPDFKKYDEDKCMLGFLSAQAAKVAYLGHYNDKRFFGSMSVLPFEEFEKKVLHTFDLKRPTKIAATPLQMISEKFKLWPSLPAWLTGETKGDTALEHLIDDVSPEEEPPTIEPEVVAVPPEVLAPTLPPGPRKPAPDTAPKEAPMDKQSAMLKAAYDLGVSLAHEHHEKLAAGEGEIIRTIRRALSKGLNEEATSLARTSVEGGRISPEMLERLARSGEGVTSAEAKLWQSAGKPAPAAAASKAAPEAAAAATEGGGGAMGEVNEVLRAGRPKSTTSWQHTPEEMRAYARGGEEALPAVATPAPTSSISGAAEEAGASSGGTMLPVLGGAGLGAGGVLAGQSLMGNKPAPSPYYKMGADSLITGLSGNLLKSKTMTMPKPNTSALPMTPKLQNVLAKLSASLGDPMFWQGGQEAMAPEQAPAASAEEVVTQLPIGTFQGLNMKLSPEGERSTNVKVTPEALGSAETLQAIFQAEPGAKVEVEIPEAPAPAAGGPVEGGAGGPPLPEGLMGGEPPPGAVPPEM